MKKFKVTFAVLAVLLGLGICGLWVAIAQPMGGKNKPSLASVDPLRLRAHVTKLSAEYAPRSHAHTANLARTAAYIREQLAGTGAVVSNQHYQVRDCRYENIVATFPSSNRSMLVVGAHYDTCGDTPGADDNASGVAGLLELAALLGRASLTHTVELVFYCTEEPPYFASDDMGSAHHAAGLNAEGRAVKAMLVLEMIGYFSSERGSQVYPSGIMKVFYPSAGNYIAVVGDQGQRALIRTVKAAMRGATSLPVESLCAPSSIPGVDFSDHRNYWRQGYPAVMITDTAFYRNMAYHQQDDTADRLDYESMAKVVIAVYEAVCVLDTP